MKLYVYLRVKFRAFGITFGNYEWQYRVELGPPPAVFKDDSPIPNSARVVINERGVVLKLWQ